jgi:hypothetical protein
MAHIAAVRALARSADGNEAISCLPVEVFMRAPFRFEFAPKNDLRKRYYPGPVQALAAVTARSHFCYNFELCAAVTGLY